MRKVLTSITLSLGAGLILFATGCEPAEPPLLSESQEQAQVPEKAEKAKTDQHRHEELQDRLSERRKEGAAAQPVVPRRADAGQLSVDKKIHDFGKVDGSQKVKCEFVLTNSGKETVTIKKPIGKSCGCTVPSLKTYTLEPKQSVPLKVTFSTPRNPGVTSKKVWIDTLPPAMPARLNLTIKAEVKKYINITPKQFEFERKASADTDRTIVLESIDGTPFKVTGYNAFRKAVTVTFDPEVSAAKHTLPVKIDMKKLSGSQGGVITINLNHKKTKQVQVRYKVVSPFTAHPTSRRFMGLKPGQTKKSEIKITSNFNESFELGDVRGEKGIVQVVKIVKIKNGYQIMVEMTVPKDDKRRMIRDYLLVPIKGRPNDILKVLCYAVVK